MMRIISLISQSNVYHKDGCPYVSKISGKYKKWVNVNDRRYRKFRECQYCGGFRGHARVFGKRPERYSKEKKVSCYYEKTTGYIYLKTDIGFWKIVEKRDTKKLLLFHLNRFDPNKTVKDMSPFPAHISSFLLAYCSGSLLSFQELCHHAAHASADGTTQLENLGNAMIPLAGGLTALQEITWGTIAKAFTTLATGLSSLLLVNFGNAKKFTDMANSFKLIADTIRELPTDAGQSMKDFAAAIRDNKSDISAAASEMLTGLSTTIEGGTTTVSASMGSLASAIITSFNGYQSSWTTLGSNVSIGIANGIGRGGIYVTRAVNAVAGAAIRTFQSRFNMHSPSKLMEELSENIPIGAGRGIQNGSGYLADSMYIAFSPALAVLDSILNSDLDYTPTIRPVVDITDAVSGANNMREMFSGINPRSIWGGIGDFGGINIDGAAIDYKVQNDNVIGELRNLSEQMNELGEAITNMQIVLDTGVLVGETSAQMDSQLGTLAMRKGRGN